MQRKDTYYPTCKLLNKKTQVDVYYREYKNKHDLMPTYYHSATCCHLTDNGRCLMGDYPCVPHEVL